MEAMDASILVAVFFVGVIGLIVYGVFDGINRKKHKADSNSFSQAGVTVNFRSGSIKIKSNVYSAEKVTRIRWESGKGPHGNISEAYIHLDDFDNPVHNIRFMNTTDAEKFSNRLRLALSKAKGGVTDQVEHGNAGLNTEFAESEGMGLPSEGDLSDQERKTGQEKAPDKLTILDHTNIEDNRVRDVVKKLNNRGFVVMQARNGWIVEDRSGQRRPCTNVNQLEGIAISEKA